MISDRQALETLIIDNLDLERLEALLGEFNIFEVLGAVRIELRHSDFLGYLLDPQQNHGLGDTFVKKFLQKTLAGIDPSFLPISVIDLDIWGLDELEVRREWHKIDIILLSEEHDFMVVIENKIGSGEHSNQLQRYREIVTQQYPNMNVIYIFLTPEGEEPSDENYLPVSYDVVCELIEGLTDTREATLGPDVRTLMQHYTEMLRRHILSDSEIEELARRIYRKHKNAMDLIIEHKPDLQADIHEYLDDLLSKTSGFITTQSTKSYIGFIPIEWDVPILTQAENWGNNKQLLTFQFENSPTSLKLKLTIGPGPEEIRQKLLDMALSNDPPFKSAYKSLNQKWNNVLSQSIITKKDYEGRTIEDHLQKIDSFWQTFIKSTLPKMKKVLENEIWLWK